MTNSSMNTPGPTLPQRAPAGGAPSTVPTMSAIDPVKLLNKYKYALLASALAGAVIGVVAHFVLLRAYPIWRPSALLRCYPPRVSPEMSAGLNTNTEEMRQFMATEAKIMTGDKVLDRLAKNPQLQSRAPKWAVQFMEKSSDGAERFNHLKALEDLKDRARARVVPQSSLVELSVSWRDKVDATTILQLLTDTYIKVVDEQTKAMSSESVEALRSTLMRLDEEMRGLVANRAKLMVDAAAGGSISGRQQSENQRLMLLVEDRIQKTNMATMLSEEIAGMQERANSADGDKFTDDMRAEAERDPQVMGARGNLQDIERGIKSLVGIGYPETHRALKNYNSQRDAAQAALDGAIRDALDRTFRGRLDRLESDLRGVTEQLAQNEDQIEAVNKSISGARAIENQIVDLDQRIALTETRRAATNGQLSDIQTVGTMESSRRVLVQQEAQPPNRLAFPKIELLLLAGIVLTVVLTGGTFFIRELVDQRVKGPADIGIIPRTRLLGWIPDAAEDPESGGATETAFRDRSRGVVAESFRQLRAVMLKRAHQTGHKTVVIMAGLPGSGATTVACNMALAAAAADRRVLLIDANLRRPAIHRVFGKAEAPGLADVLAKQASLESAIQTTSVASLDILAAGTRDMRVVERLSTDSMSDLLAHARGTYDLVLIDIAPAIVAGDGVALASRCDASILVVKAFGEKRGMVARVKNELTDSRGEFLGVIVNAVRAATGGYLKGNIKVAAEYQKS
jgi:polysaccharide biosynthesis transport protein